MAQAVCSFCELRAEYQPLQSKASNLHFVYRLRVTGCFSLKKRTESEPDRTQLRMLGVLLVE